MSDVPATDIAKQDSALAVFGETKVSPEWLNAATVLADGKIPKGNVKSHLGRGGKIFHYIDHVWVTQQLRAYFGPYWSTRSGQWQMFSDGSVAIPVTLRIALPGQEPYEITQTGSFGANQKMMMSDRVASAESRGLVRCVWRLFGLGDEFYEVDPEDMTPEEAWGALKNYVEKNKGDLDEYINILKNMGVTRENLVDNDVFASAYELAYDICVMAKPKINLPDQLLGGNGNQNAPEMEAEVVQSESAPEPVEEVVNIEAAEVAPEKQNETVPEKQLVDPNFKPTPTREGWASISQRLMSVGVHEEDIKSVMRQKFGVYEAKNHQQYWDYLAAEVNAGRIPLNGNGLPQVV